MRISLVTQHALYGDDPMGVTLARAINHAHAAARDLIEDFVITQAPLRIWHIHFGHYAFKSISRDPGFESLTQETTHTNASFETNCCAAPFAFRLGLRRTADRVRSPVRIAHL